MDQQTSFERELSLHMRLRPQFRQKLLAAPYLQHDPVFKAEMVRQRHLRIEYRMKQASVSQELHEKRELLHLWRSKNQVVAAQLEAELSELEATLANELAVEHAHLQSQVLRVTKILDDHQPMSSCCPSSALQDEPVVQGETEQE